MQAMLVFAQKVIDSHFACSHKYGINIISKNYIHVNALGTGIRTQTDTHFP